MCTAWCPSLCAEEGAAGSAGGRGEEYALTLMMTMVQSQVRIPNISRRLNERVLFHMIFHYKEYFLRGSAVADAWRALKSPSFGDSSLDGALSGMSTTSPSEGLSVAPGSLGDTSHFYPLAGGTLGTRSGKYSR